LHSVQAALLPTAYVPAGQGAQVVDDEAPTTLDAVPDAHGVQDVAPASEYEPAEQLVHEAEPAEEKVPAAHGEQESAEPFQAQAPVGPCICRAGGPEKPPRHTKV